MSKKPFLPKGTRDFNPLEVRRRQFITKRISEQFKLFGFSPIETPSFENSATLKGKYGEEGDRLIFDILNNGAYLSKVNEDTLKAGNEPKLTPKISKRALRYDLTVPFARYVVQHQNEITFPFKRYQIQPVWRADRPQHGRFQEFYQCDADVVGSKSLLQEVDFVKLYAAAFDRLGLNGCTIKMNNRKILSGIARKIGAKDKVVDFTVALDKLDKIGEDKVIQEMVDKGIPAENLDELKPIFSLSGSFEEKLDAISEILGGDQEAEKGIDELRFIFDRVKTDHLRGSFIDLDITLARGLDYYTGCIFEVEAPQGIKIGSIGGGGRYDDLTGIFGMKDVSGVGVSFGLDRIYLVLQELDLFPDQVDLGVQIMLVNFGEKEADHCLDLLDRLRSHGIAAELYPDSTKMGKQMAYADKNNIPYALLVGENEIEVKTYTLKNMRSGEQEKIGLDEVISRLNPKKFIL